MLNGTLSFSKNGPGNINDQLMQVVKNSKYASMNLDGTSKQRKNITIKQMPKSLDYGTVGSKPRLRLPTTVNNTFDEREPKLSPRLNELLKSPLLPQFHDQERIQEMQQEYN